MKKLSLILTLLLSLNAFASESDEADFEDTANDVEQKGDQPAHFTQEQIDALCPNGMKRAKIKRVRAVDEVTAREATFGSGKKATCRRIALDKCEAKGLKLCKFLPETCKSVSISIEPSAGVGGPSFEGGTNWVRAHAVGVKVKCKK